MQIATCGRDDKAGGGHAVAGPRPDPALEQSRGDIERKLFSVVERAGVMVVTAMALVERSCRSIFGQPRCVNAWSAWTTSTRSSAMPGTTWSASATA